MPSWLLIAACIVSWGTWAICLKQGVRYVSPMMLLIINSYVYSVIAPIALLYVKATTGETNWNPRAIAWSATSVLLVTIANFCFGTATQKVPVYLVVGFTSVYPIFTFALSAIFLGEAVTLMKLVGIVVTVAGVVMLSL